jgi:hypothetical protein
MALKKGANALYIGVLSPLHPLTKISYDRFGKNRTFGNSRGGMVEKPRRVESVMADYCFGG